MPSELKDLGELLEQLGDNPESVPIAPLYHLSDLAGEGLSMFSSTWEILQVEQRRRLAHSLVELAEVSFEVNFDAIFRKMLDDPDEQVRSRAIDGLWENQNLNLIGPLLTMLRNDPSPQVRASAATGLGRYVLAGELEELEDPVHSRIVTELLTVAYLTGESIKVRRRAVESVAYACTPETLEAIHTAYYDNDELMRLSAIVGMGRSCDKRWTTLILEELESDSSAMRYEATCACGELGIRQAVSSLSQLMQDPDSQVSMAAIWALGQIGGEQAKQVLMDAYNDADEDTTLALDEAMAELALYHGDVDFVLYDLDGQSEGEPLEDTLFPLWVADDQEPEND